MTPIDIKIPTGAEISNSLYAGADLDDLTQDLATVRLPNGYYIDLGWYPEHDPAGRYVIRVFWEYWDNQAVEPVTTRNTIEAVRAVETLAAHFSQNQVPISRAKTARPIPMISI